MTSDAYAAVHELVLSAFPTGCSSTPTGGSTTGGAASSRPTTSRAASASTTRSWSGAHALPACAISDLAVWNHNHGVIDAVDRGTVWNHNAYAIANRTFPGCLAAPTYELATTDWGPQGEYMKLRGGGGAGVCCVVSVVKF